MKTPANYIDLYDSSVNVWEEHVDEVSLRRRLYDPLVRLLRARGWTVRQDPTVARHYPSLKKWHRLATKGELQASLEMHGRHLAFEIWQDRYGITHPHGGRYEHQKLAKMPPMLARRCRLEQLRITEWLQGVTAYPVTDRRPNPKETALEQLAREYASCWHTDAALGRARYTNGDRDRTSANGQLLEHGQVAWFADRNGRILRGQAFYRLNNMWWLKVGARELTSRSCFEIFAIQPHELRQKRNAALRARRLREQLAAAIEALDFKRAALLQALLPAGTLKLTVQFDRKTA